ncbi:hypothetical protein QLL95_gp0030 [Cotonvirus japonicus]|uniref:Uncharacterized protein n=1 Tax=Cotonvirus japonicus TaxID=2811091 RepID=A0ABM7NQS5_9VIRU|nr:hypothetical protein QLL95_gp0030 [Cotonvirus japonicus]BCS82519.1 hypothetical protein [Cotonvirus japonicus]
MYYFIEDTIILSNEIFYYILVLLTSRDVLNFAKSFHGRLFPPILEKIYHEIKKKETLEKLKKHVGAKPFFPKSMIDHTESDEDNIYKLDSPIRISLDNQLIGKLMRINDLSNRKFCWMIAVLIPNRCLKNFENVARNTGLASGIGNIYIVDHVINNKKETYIQKILNTDGLEKYDNYTVAVTLIWQLRELLRNFQFTIR